MVLLASPRCRITLLLLRGSLLACLLLVPTMGQEGDRPEARKLLWQRFADILGSASPEQQRLLRERAEALGSETFPVEQLMHVNDNIHRHLQGPVAEPKLGAPKRKCGEVISSLSVSDLNSFAKVFVNALLPSNSALGAFAPVTLTLLLGSIKYPIRVQKICASCQQIQSIYQGESFLKDTSAHGFAKYCGKGRYGYNVTTSGLLLLPIDPKTGKIFTKKLRSAVFTHGTTPGSQGTATGVFPSNLTGELQASGADQLKLLTKLLDIIPAMFGTSAGAVSISPDNIGYGESYTYPKSYLVYSLYQQASVSLWLKARRLLLTRSSAKSSCALLDNVVSVTGYSEGGYSAFATCLALNKLTVGKTKLRVLRCQCGGTPFDLDYLISYTFEQLKNNSAHPTAPALPVFLGNSYSSTNPDLVNTNKGQDVLKKAYKLLAPIWLELPSFELLIRAIIIAGGALRTVSTSLVDLYIGNRPVKPIRSCSGPGLKRNDTRFFCQAIGNNNLVNALLSADFPTVVCHARDDRLVPFGNIPNFSSNRKVQFYRPSLPQLTPAGDHAGGKVFCGFGAILAFSIPSNASDPPQLMTNLTDTSVCKLNS